MAAFSMIAELNSCMDHEAENMHCLFTEKFANSCSRKQGQSLVHLCNPKFIAIISLCVK